MGGSYQHIVNDDGSFRGTDLIDNLGDAYEALQQCYDMIQHLTGGDKTKIYEAWLEGYFKKRCPPENLPLATYERFWEQ
jgi:hypothetical protein